jgi:hypothetical protein
MTATPDKDAAPLAYTIDDFVKAVGVGRSKVYEEIRLGRLRARHIGRRTVIIDSDARAYLASLPALPVAA